MATDPTQMFGALLGTLQQTGQIGENAQRYQGNQQRLALGALALDAQQKQQQQNEQYQQDVQSYYADPSLERLSSLAAKYPDRAAALKQSYDILNEGQKQSALTQFGSLYNAADNGKVDLVRAQLQQIKSAEQKQGVDTSDVDQAMTSLDSDPDGALRYIKGFAQTHLAAAGAKGFQLPGSSTEGKVVGNTIGHYEGGKWVVDYTAPDKPQYRSVDVYNSDGDKIGTKVIQVNGSAEGGGQQVSGGAGVNSAPRSVRNNNPGNLKASAFTKKLPGYQGTDPDGFAVFDSPQSGSNAQLALLKNYRSRGFNTVRKIINRWAPPSDGNDTSAYIGTVAKQLGVNPDDTLSADMLPKLQSAISRVEGGPNNPSSGAPQSASAGQGGNVVYESVGSGGGAGGMTDAAVRNAAQVYNLTGQLPTRISQKDKGRILNSAADLNNGIDMGDIVAGWAGRKADTKALGDLQSLASKVESFESAALRNGALALRLSTRVGNGNVRAFNAWINAGRKATGDPNVKALNAALTTFANEFAKVTSSATGGGVTSDSAREEAQSLINSADSPEQLVSVMQTLKADMENRHRGLIEGRQALLGRIRDSHMPKSQGTAPSGFRIVAIDGKPVR